MSKLHLLAVNVSPLKSESDDQELERRLNLYQLFLKLYDHHTSLLDEILQLENIGQRSFTGVKPRYIQAVVEDAGAYVITNLREGQTQSLRQPQGIWTIGRDRTCGIQVCDRRLSRRHAGIQYIENQGFYLVDFKSTNGSYINGELVHEPMQLKDGDHIRLGSMAFSFFIHHACQSLPTVPAELLMPLPTNKAVSQREIPTAAVENNLHKETLHFTLRKGESNQQAEISPCTQISAAQQSEILDRFMSRRITDSPT